MTYGGEHPKLNVVWLVTWPLTLAFAVMVFMSVEELRRPTETSGPSIGGPDWAVHFPQRIDTITNAIQRAPARLPAPVEERQGSGNIRWIHRHYDVAIDPERQPETEAFITSLYDTDPGVTISSQGFDGGVEVRVGLDGLLTHTMRFKWQEAAPPPPPRVAIIVDTLGDDLYIARQFAGLEAPVALAVRPFRPFSKEVAELARLSKREVLLHLPSGAEIALAAEADGGAAQPVGSEDTPAAQAEALMTSVPNAVGVIAESTGGDSVDAAAAGSLMIELERRGLFRVGHRQKPAVGDQKAIGPAKIIMLSGDGDPAALTKWARAVAKARESGVAIGLTRPTPEALEALRGALVEWQSSGIEIVPVSGLMSPVTLSAR